MTSVTPTSESTSPTAPNVIAPRPPVIPGESNLPAEKQEEWSGRTQNRSFVHSIPRKYSLSAAENVSDMRAPLGFEPEGRSCGGGGGGDGGDGERGFREDSRAAVSSNCLKWAESWQALLNDVEGLNLFQQFLEQEDPDRFHMLEFWLACKGLSKQPPAQAHQLVRVIYAQLFLKAQLGIGDDLRRSITQQIKTETSHKRLLSPTIFNEACVKVERVMNEVMHPNFLRSDIYLNYVQKMQADSCTLDSGFDAPAGQREAPAVQEEPDDELPETFSQPLPIVDENAELSCSVSSRSNLTKPPPDSFPLRFLRQFGSTSRPSPSRRLYNCSYNPVSRQDSELQSLSSDARTDSMSDLSFDEMTSARETYAYKRQHQRQLRQMRESANMNQNSDLAYNLIPRTFNPQARESAKPQDPEVFAKSLILKLEKLKKERDVEEIMVHKLSTVEDNAAESAAGTLSHQTLTEEVMQRNDDDCQEILDNHVSRVWKDKTPRRSPCLGTPVRPKSPEGRKVWPPHTPHNKALSHSSATAVRVPHSHVSANTKRKEKDVCSLFSLDSGNGTDPAEGVEHRYRNLAKSKSMLEQAEQTQPPEYYLGCCQRGAGKVWSSSRRTLTDSGVSMVSGGHVENIASQSSQYKEKLVSSWLLDSNRISNEAVARGAPCSTISEEKDSIVSSSSKHKAKFASGYSHNTSRSKSGIPERGASGPGSVKNVLPSQPFVADPSMPPFPFHSVDTDTQLEETRRRLNEMGPKLNKFPSATVGASKTYENVYSGVYSQGSSKTEIPPQRPSTLTRSTRKPFTEESSYTTVVYNFSDEQMPYLSRVPGNPITLKQFKDYMPKKGRYRYFFVTPCEDLEMQPIQEEITDDCEFLPLWRGKVIAQIKAVE